jgi:hypothetical protein
VSKGTMRLIITLFIISLVTSCSREVYPSIEGFYFSVNGLTKSSLLTTLDHFAEINDFEKLQEGGENMLPEAKKNFMLAKYKNKQGYEFTVNNVLNKNCFSVNSYDKNRLGAESAILLSQDLNQWLVKNYQNKFKLHNSQYCEIAH